MIDINLACFFTDAFLPTIRTSDAQLQTLKTENAGRFFFAMDFEPMVMTMRSVRFPTNIPVLDFVAEHRDFATPQDSSDGEVATRHSCRRHRTAPNTPRMVPVTTSS
jgi:hypothetical protein